MPPFFSARSVNEQYEVEEYFTRTGTLMPKKYLGYYIGYNKTSPDVSLYDWQVRAPILALLCLDQLLLAAVPAAGLWPVPPWTPRMRTGLMPRHAL